MLTIPFTLPVLLTGGTIAQGIFAAVLLALQRRNRRANSYLALLLLGFSLWLCDSFFRLAGIYAQQPNFYFLPIYYSLAFGPLIYLYVRSVTQQDFRFERLYGLHFLPVALQAGLYLFLRSRDYNFRRDFWYEVHQPYTYDLEYHLTLVSLLVYLWLSLRVVRRYQTWIQNRYSEIAEIDLRWLRTVLALLAIVASLWLIDSLLREFYFYYPAQPLSATALGIALLAMAAGGLLQSSIGRRAMVGAPEVPKKSDPDLAIDPVLTDRIEQQMRSGAYFLDPDLDLESFAAQLQVPSRTVSQHINHGLGKTFIDFVNEHRVASVKEHLELGDLAHLTLFGVALESGFKSKSTFNRVFRRMAGQSPSEYQRTMGQNAD